MLDHIFLTVSDIDRSIAFYERVLPLLGITARLDYDGKDGPCQRRPKSDPLYGVNAEVKVTHLKRLGYCRASVRRAEPGATKHGGEST